MLPGENQNSVLNTFSVHHPLAAHGQCVCALAATGRCMCALVENSQCVCAMAAHGHFMIMSISLAKCLSAETVAVYVNYCRRKDHFSSCLFIPHGQMILFTYHCHTFFKFHLNLFKRNLHHQGDWRLVRTHISYSTLESFTYV